MRKLCLSITLLLAGALFARAQFYETGSDPGHLKWYSIETPYYQVVYPKGLDSLARHYAQLLEQFRVPSGNSIGLMPGSLQWKKLPVVLHPYNGYSNGSVPWAPSRMDLYTVMPSFGSDPVSWPVQLTVHEPRHQAQWQMGYTGFLKWLGYLTGEAASPLGFALYLDLGLAEGDAVASETGFGFATRARTADFLDYYRMALDQGDFRSWDRWRYGSFKHATPDHYTLGYITIAGVRYYYDYPLFTADFLERSRKNPFSFTPGNMKKTASERSGKPFKETFSDILHNLNDQWREEAEERKPFIPQEQITHAGNFPRSYSCTVFLNGDIYMIRDDATRGTELVRIRDGKDDIISPMAGTANYIWPDDNFLRLYWSETVSDIRWELSHRSIIRYLDVPRNKIVDLTRDGRLYNPQVSPDGLRLVAVEQPWEGGCCITVLSTLDGTVLQRIRVPDGIHATEATWWEDSFYVLGITDGGTGLYHVTADGLWNAVLEPSYQKAVILCAGDGYLEWLSDRDGSNELYRYYPEEGRLVQRTSARYGLADPAEDDEFLYYISQTPEGTMLFRTPQEELQSREVNYADVHNYPMEDALVAQERALGPVPEAGSSQISQPKRYYKLAHPLRLHTWLPFYVNYDAVEEQSLDFSYETASLGLTGFFQNTLGSFYGYLGYSAHPDTETDGPWMHSLHGKFTYTGLFPVFEASFDLGGSWAQQYYINQFNSYKGTTLSAHSYMRNTPLYSVQLSTWVPLRFQKGGMLAGFIPKLTYSLSNNGFSTNTVLWTPPEHVFSGLPATYQFSGIVVGQNFPMQRLSGSLRGYWMLPVAESGIYPRLGIGMEAGVSLRPGLMDTFTPSAYLYGYGYLPGLWLPQGLRITGLFQKQLRSRKTQFGENYALVLPRGFDSFAGASGLLARNNSWQYRVTADYAVPIYVGDLSLGFLTYIKYFLLTPHADFTGFPEGNLWSAGADLTAELAHLLRLPFGGSVGVSFSYLGGSWYSQIAGPEDKPFSVSMVFGFDL